MGVESPEFIEKVAGVFVSQSEQARSEQEAAAALQADRDRGQALIEHLADVAAELAIMAAEKLRPDTLLEHKQLARKAGFVLNAKYSHTPIVSGWSIDKGTLLGTDGRLYRYMREGSPDAWLGFTYVGEHCVPSDDPPTAYYDSFPQDVDQKQTTGRLAALLITETKLAEFICQPVFTVDLSSTTHEQ